MTRAMAEGRDARAKAQAKAWASDDEGSDGAARPLTH
jgi:hypothetical protein